jgi:hypothetical protein
MPKHAELCHAALGGGIDRRLALSGEWRLMKFSERAATAILLALYNAPK